MQHFTFNSDVTEDREGKIFKMIFSGYLTLQNARQIKETLQNQVGDYNKVVLMAQDVSGIDVTFLQIVESFRKTGEEAGKQVRVLMDLPYDLKTLMANAGVSYPLK